MSGTRGGVGRIVAIAIALAVALLLALAAEARAAKYAVAQCGWHVGADAGWADTSGGDKFRSDAWCVPPPGADPFDGVHLKSLTRQGPTTVSGTRFARWRWTAPAGTAITQVRGSWWHALHDGLEQRLGAQPPGGGFDVFAAAATTDTTPREFVAGFTTPVAAFEDRLLCARGASKWCSLQHGSWAGLRALTITLVDPSAPAAAIGGGLLAGGWRRGTQSVAVHGADVGSGLRFGETILDGARVGLTEFGCAKAEIGGQWRATAMRPCALEADAAQSVATTGLSDGPHAVGACVADFAGNAGCAPTRTVLVDNTPPAHPRAPRQSGGEGWRRENEFDLSWSNPDQGPASPIAGAVWRLTGPGGFDSGVRFADGRDRTSLAGLSLPAAGTYSLRLWLRDEAGNEDPAGAAELSLRLDDAAPQVAFAPGSDDVAPARIEAGVADALSGPAAGQLLYRRADSSEWIELPTKLLADSTGTRLVAPTPPLGPGTYLFRADASDAAGNGASTTLRADGTRMAIRVPTPPPPAKTRLSACLRAPGTHTSCARHGVLTIPFGAAATLSGRLTNAAGAGLAGRELRVVSHPSPGALGGAGRRSLRSGRHGGFALRLPPGPSRRLTVGFPGGEGLARASRAGLQLRVRSGISLRVVPRRLATGEVLRLRGRVASRGAPLPRRGKLVAIQYREAATGRWRPVLVTRSDRGGRFRARYRFRYLSGAARIRLRAAALSEAGWPYAPGASTPVTVRVGGRR